MDQVFPRSIATIDGPQLYRDDARPVPEERPWVLVNMVASVDGAVTVDGRSGGLSGPGDRAIFFALRSVADIILVGAGTVRAENYGPPRISPEDRVARQERGQAPNPTIAVVSGRLDLDPRARLFVDSPTKPIIFTTAQSNRERWRALESGSEVVAAGDAAFEPATALRLLRDRGARLVVCEGGPTLNGWLFGSNLVDELCLTVSPVLASGTDPRVVRGVALDPPVAVVLDRELRADGFSFLRYLVRARL